MVCGGEFVISGVQVSLSTAMNGLKCILIFISKTGGGSEVEKHFLLQFPPSTWSLQWGMGCQGMGAACLLCPACQLQAGWRIEALFSAGILKPSAGKQLLEACCCPGLTDWMAQERFWCFFRLKTWPHGLHKGMKQGIQNSTKMGSVGGCHSNI